MKSPKLVFCSLLIAPLVLAEPDPQQNGKTFGDGSGLPKYLAHFDVKGGPNGEGDGVLDQEECQAMEQARLQIRKKLMQDWDSDGDGQICDKEKAQAKVRLRQMIEEQRLVRFDEADEDENGELSWDEFATLPGIANKLEADPDSPVVAAIFARLDADGSGEISKEEFLAAVHDCDQNRDGSGDGKSRGDGDGSGGGNGGGSGS